MDAKRLRRRLRQAGLSEQVVSAAWPAWWSDAAASSPSAQAELRLALSRRLGLAARALVDDEVAFLWRDGARFKNLTAEEEREQAALVSFGMAVGRLALRATAPGPSLAGREASQLRGSILRRGSLVDLRTLVSACWAFGIPVVHLRVFPLAAKRMHAMVVGIEGRHAILLGRDARYPAPVAFTLAHEIGHIALGHLRGAPALVDMKDPGEAAAADGDEAEADAFGLELLTGSREPDIQVTGRAFGARRLADAARAAGFDRGIEPGTLAMCYAFRSGDWTRGTAALAHIYSEAKPVWREVNRIAAEQLDLDLADEEGAEYLKAVMGAADA